MCVVAATVGAAAAGGLASGAAGSLFGGGGGGGAPSGGGGGGNPQSLGQLLTGILGGGTAAGLGISGLAGGNLNQLQAGAAAANPFGQYSSGFVPFLQQLLSPSGGVLASMNMGQAQEQGYLSSILGNARIGTNTGALSGMGNISTPAQTGMLQNMLNSPTQLLGSVQQGNQQLGNILGQNPYSFTQGEQFQYQQGLGALQTAQAAQGLTGSGQQGIALEQYGQNFASQAIQQNIQNMFGANAQAQNLQKIVNQMDTSQWEATAQLAGLLGNQQQASFANQLGVQQLQSQQQQNTMQNLSNLLTQTAGINNQYISQQESLINPLLMATQATTSSPAAAGGILSNLGVANQVSGGNLASGLGGLASGLGNLLGGINFGGQGYGGNFSTGLGTTTGGGYNSLLYGPSGYGGNATYGGENTYGFTI